MVLKANKNTALFVRITIWMMCMDLLCIEVFRYPSENVSNHSIPFDSIHSWRSIKMYKSIIESIRRKYWLFLSQVGGRIWSTNINSHGALHEGAEKLQFMPVFFFILWVLWPLVAEMPQTIFSCTQILIQDTDVMKMLKKEQKILMTFFCALCWRQPHKWPHLFFALWKH